MAKMLHLRPFSTAMSALLPTTPFRRSPIITIMGHVDHGKTTLLDRLRHANVAAGEPGGITQHLGAFTVNFTTDSTSTAPPSTLCFLDTPGHAAFKAVREHGTAVTDLVILVLAMDDGVMPTTVEAVKLSQRLRLPMVVALSKADLFQSAPARQERKRAIAQQLALLEVLLEGEPTFGETQAVMVSALTGLGLPDLMMAVQAQADFMDDARAVVDAQKPGSGFIIEAKRQIGLGNTSSIILKNGHLKVGDWLVAGEAYGRVKTIIGQANDHLNILFPSTPALVTGWRSDPVAGEEVVVVGNEAEAKELTFMITLDRQNSRLLTNKSVMAERSQSNSNLLEQYRQKLAEKLSRRLVSSAGLQQQQQQQDRSDKPQLEVIIKADVQGSVEALQQALSEIPSKKAHVKIVTASQGELSAHDVEMARCCKNPLVILFNAACPRELRKLMTHLKIPFVESNIIYTLIDDVERRLRSLLPKTDVVEVLGEAEVQQLFQVQHGKSPQLVAGCIVTDKLLQTGKIARDGERFAFRIVRAGAVLFEGSLKSMRHGKEEVAKVPAGMECGLIFEGNPAVLVGDVVQAVRIYEQEPTLQ